MNDSTSLRTVISETEERRLRLRSELEREIRTADDALAALRPDDPGSVKRMVEANQRAGALRHGVASLDDQITALESKLRAATAREQHTLQIARLLEIAATAECLVLAETAERVKLNRVLTAGAKRLVHIRARLVSARRQFLVDAAALAPGVASLELSHTRDRARLEAEVTDLLDELRAAGAKLDAVRIRWTEQYGDRSAIDNEHHRYMKLELDDAVNLAKQIVSALPATEISDEAEAA